MAKFDVTGEQYFGITKKLLHIERQVCLTAESSIDPELVKLALQDIVDGKFIYEREDNTILSLLSKDESIIIDPCDGYETITNAKKTFKSEIDKNFENLFTDKPSKATKETVVEVYQTTKNATLVQMFASFGADFDKLCLTQHQIKSFCEKYFEWLDVYATFFLLKVGDQFVVASVGTSSPGRLFIGLNKFSSENVWCKCYKLYMVVPKRV